jgi:hypothetical protein
MHLPTMQVLITLLLALSVIYRVFKAFQQVEYDVVYVDVRVDEAPVPYIHQFICDYNDFVDGKFLIIPMESEEETKARECEKLRKEFKEWMENCDDLFGKKKVASHLRVIDGAA